MTAINVTKPFMPERAVLDRYLDQIFKSVCLTNNGPLVQELESRLKDYLGVKNVILTSNGTLALQVAYKLLGLTGEAITTPFTFIATASSLAWEGLDVVFSDIDKNSFNLDISDAEKKISHRTSAIVPVHVFGNPCDVESIQKIAYKHGLKVIYDASHAFGVKYQGESILNWGDVSTLSFHATKLFHTVEGGALIINDDNLCRRARKMINFGITGPESIECLGINAKMNEFQAAMGLSLLEQMDNVMCKLKELSKCYDDLLSGKVLMQRHLTGSVNNHGYYPVLFSDEKDLLKVQKALNQHDIYSRRYFYPSLDRLDFLAEKSDNPVSKNISERILCLPLYFELTKDQCRLISEIVLANVKV